MNNETLNELLVDEIKDIYDAEKQLVKALPKMAKACDAQDLADCIQQHLGETQNQVSRLEKVFEFLKTPAKGKPCKGMKGLLEEGTEAVQDQDKGPVRDFAIIAAAQRVEHYEISAYGTARALAGQVDNGAVAKLLLQTENEEKLADTKFSEIAKLIFATNDTDEEREMATAGNVSKRNTARRSKMPARSVRQQSEVALLLIDVINHFEFPDAKKVLRHALAIASTLARLKTRARRAGIATIYVNDNFGQWRSDARTIAKYCLRPQAPGSDFVRAVIPDEDDYFVLKPMHSAFYQTPLDTLLRYLGTSSVIICGIATNSCILCSVHDAKMRDLTITVPSDCCAARSPREHNQALDHIKAMTGASVLPATKVRFDKNRG